MSGALPKVSELSLMENQLGAMVDLQQSAVFEEPFYIVVLERTNNNTIMHMWRLVIASHPPNPGSWRKQFNPRIINDVFRIIWKYDVCS